MKDLPESHRIYTQNFLFLACECRNTIQGWEHPSSETYYREETRFDLITHFCTDLFSICAFEGRDEQILSDTKLTLTSVPRSP